MSLYDYVPHPHVAARRLHRPAMVREQHGPGFNGTLARWITEGVGTMWCAYAFAALALAALPQAIHGGVLAIVQWVSQTFLQLVLLSVIMVGQQVIGVASDKRAIQTYNDAEALLAESQALQVHLAAQDKVLEALAERLGLEVTELIRAATDADDSTRGGGSEQRARDGVGRSEEGDPQD